MTAVATQPAVSLYGYEAAWVADRARFKAGNWSRQTGKSFTVALEAVDDAAETGDDWVLLSRGERQSKELMAKVKMHLEAYGMAAVDLQETFFADTRTTMLVATLPNGARIMGLPANPDTARGFSANVILDEFAFHADPDKIWAAIFPTVSRGYKLRVVSTPQGPGNRFHKIMTETGDRWSHHTVDIYRAVAEGAPHDIDELRAGIDDEDIWAQEYECRFIDEASAWLSYDLIAAAYSDAIPAEIDGDDFDPAILADPVGPLYAGLDIGRRHDRTVLWIVEQIGDVFVTRAILILHRWPFRRQQELLQTIIRDHKIARVCIDATGIGAQMAEETRDTFGYRVEPVVFTAPVKEDLAVRMRRGFEDRRIRIPHDRRLRDDLHSIKKITTVAGNIRFDAQRTKEGHADRFWAGALALLAGDPGVTPEVILL